MFKSRKLPLAAASETTTPSELEGAGEKVNNDLTIQNPRANVPVWKWILTLVGIYSGALLYGLDTTIAADVQAPIFESFGNIEKLPWIGIGFPMASVAVILITGRLFGLFDIKWLMISYVLLFEIGSALCGGAPSLDALIIGRVIAGMGGSGMYIGALSYISNFTSAKESTLYNALIGMCWGIGAILGPVVGGAFSESSATWRWAFYINLPLAAILAPVYLFVFPSFILRKDISTLEKLKRLDWVGTFLNAGVFVIFMVVLSFSGSLWSWDSPRSIALWTVWGIFLVAFIFQQAFAVFTTTDRRIFPVHFLRSRTMILLYIATGCAAAPVAVVIYYIPLFFQFTRGDNALDAAVRLLPFICIYIFSVMFAGALLPRFGRYAPWYTAAGILITIGGALMFTIDISTSKEQVYGYEVIIAVGTGIGFQNAYAVAAAKVRNEDKANAIGFINVAQIGTIAIALSMSGSIFQNIGFSELEDALGPLGVSEELIRAGLAGTGSSMLQMAGPQITRLVVSIVADTIAKLFAIVFSSGAVLIVVSFLLRWEKVSLELTAGG